MSGSCWKIMFVLPISLQIWVCDQAQFNVEFAKKLLLKDEQCQLYCIGKQQITKRK